MRIANPSGRLSLVVDGLAVGQPVADFQGVQLMLADMAMKLEAGRQLTYHAAACRRRR
jgi:alkylation response protein AidB-like acyl-CoA dehydrogenase